MPPFPSKAAHPHGAHPVLDAAEAFVARAFLRNRHVQTLGAAFPLHAPPRGFEVPPTQWRKFALPSDHASRRGALLGLGWWQPGAHPGPTVVLVHGVGGSSESRYVVRAAVRFYRAGYHVVRLNLRGAGASTADAPSLYHAGLTEDLTVVAEALAKDARVTQTFVLGFSLGGNVTLKAAGEWGASPPEKVTAVAAVSAPMNLAQTSKLLESLETLPYRVFVLAGLIGQARAFKKLHPGGASYTARQLARVRTVRDYDEVVVAPMHGFPNATAYYESESSGQYLPRIRIPTLVVHAEDDPMVPGFTVSPWLRALPASSPVEIAWTDCGGHVGWFASLEESHWLSTWPLERARTFFDGLVKGASKGKVDVSTRDDAVLQPT